MEDLIKELEEVRDMLNTNVHVDWEGGDPKEEFIELSLVMSRILTDIEDRKTVIGKNLLKRSGYIVDGMWTHQDVMMYAEDDMGIDLTSEQLNDVVSLIGARFDASIGINWEFIEIMIQEVTND